MDPEATKLKDDTRKTHEEGYCGKEAGCEVITLLPSTQRVSSAKRSAPSTVSEFGHGDTKKLKIEQGPMDFRSLSHEDNIAVFDLDTIPPTWKTSRSIDWTSLTSFSSYDVTSGNIISAFATSLRSSDCDIISSDIGGQCFGQVEEVIDLSLDMQYDGISNLTTTAPAMDTQQEGSLPVIRESGVSFNDVCQKEKRLIDTTSGTKLKPWQCDSCSKLYMSYNSVDRHWKKKHPGEGDPRIIDIVGDSPRRPSSRIGRHAQTQPKPIVNNLRNQPELFPESQPDFSVVVDPALCTPDLSASIPTPVQTPEPVARAIHQPPPLTYNTTLDVHHMPVSQDIISQSTPTLQSTIPGDPDSHRLKIIRTAGGKGGGDVSPVIRKKLQPLAEQGSIPPLPTSGTYHTRDRTLDYDSQLGTYVRGHAHEREVWDATDGRWKSM